jgi:hypothetical protein
MKRLADEALIQSHIDDYEDERFIANQRNNYKNILLHKYASYLKSK